MRRKLNPEKKKVVGTVALTAEQWKRLKRAAKADGRSVSDYVGRRLARLDEIEAANGKANGIAGPAHAE